MSDSSWKVGSVAVDSVIKTADEAWCTPGPDGHAKWTTEDLGDFVQGVLERALQHLEQLKPEAVIVCGTDGMRCPEHEHAQAHMVDLFTEHADD